MREVAGQSYNSTLSPTGAIRRRSLRGWAKDRLGRGVHFLADGAERICDHVIEFMPLLTRTALAGVESEMAGLGIAEEDGVTAVFVFSLWSRFTWGRCSAERCPAGPTDAVGSRSYGMVPPGGAGQHGGEMPRLVLQDSDAAWALVASLKSGLHSPLHRAPKEKPRYLLDSGVSFTDLVPER